MPRSLWTGSISFGLVNVPIRLFSAVQHHEIRFHQFEKGTGKRIRYQRVAEGTDREVDYDDIVKGYEIDDGRYVMVAPDELAALEPTSTRTVDIEDFIDLEEIDPIYYDHTYYVAPDENAGAQRAYALLRDAMADAGKVGIGRFVMREKQYLAAVRPSGTVLVLETMNFPDEIRDPHDLENVDRTAAASERELRMARQLIESLTSEWKPDRYHDTYREHVMDLIDRKAKGEEVVVEPAAEPKRAVVDLMAALEASLAKAGHGKRHNPRHTEVGSVGQPGAQRKLEDMSRDALYDLAAERDVRGRSKMNKRELLEALRHAS